MKIWIMSDLHVDACDYDVAPTPEGAQAVVVAGDVCSKLVKRALPWVAANVACRGLPTIYVPGNHEFYTENISTELLKAREAAREAGVLLLAEGETAVVDGVCFIGGTLWTDYTIHGVANAPWAELDAMRYMSDHRVIRVGSQYRRWTTSDAAATHRRQKAAIEKALAANADKPAVVVTHHAPHLNSLREQAPRDLLDGAYASDLSGLMTRFRPRLWIHGHVHEHKDYRVEDTRIVANPRGYVMKVRRGDRVSYNAEDTEHQPGFTVEI
jgi:Icc-related predicted phosphoesterase